MGHEGTARHIRCAVGLCGLLAAGGGYALASGSNGGTITVCVSHHGGALYKAKRCAKHDKKLTWNKQGQQGRQGIQGVQGQTGGTGPQGPGATSLAQDWASAASPTRQTLGTIGPWTVTGLCTLSGGDTSAQVAFTGPGFHVDGMAVNQGTATNVTFTQAGPVTNQLAGVVPATSTQTASSAIDLFLPTSGSPLQALLTLVANGASPPGGATPNSCYYSAVVTPVAAPGAAPAAIFRGAAASTSSHSVFGR
jgi:hypothetical protein